MDNQARPKQKHPAATPPLQNEHPRIFLGSKVLLVLAMAMLMVVAQLISEYFPNSHLTKLGIRPRHWNGLAGIVLAPMLHGSWGHLLSNLPPFAIGTLTLFVFYERVALRAMLLLTILGGALVWCFGRDSYHVGASGLIYGLVGFLLFSGAFRRERAAMAVSGIMVLLNQGIVAGFIPKAGVSFESHIFGFLVGVVLAYRFRNINRDTNTPTIAREAEDQDLPPSHNPHAPSQPPDWDYKSRVRL